MSGGVLFCTLTRNRSSATKHMRLFQQPDSVSQSMAVDRRVEIWLNAVKQFLSKQWAEKFFELYDDGKLHPVEVVKR
jgi:hypothetical protein